MRTASFNFALFLDRLSRTAPWCLYGLGCSLLANKLLRLSDSLDVGALAALWAAILAILAAAEILRLTGKWYDREYALAWLDLKNRAGGTVISGGDTAGLKVTPRPVFRPLLASLILPLLFFVAAVLAPARETADGISAAGLKKAAADLSQKVESASENALLPEPDAEELRRQADRLAAMAEKDPVSASEALDALARSLDAAMAGQLERHLDALERAASASAALSAAEAGDGGAASAPREEMAGMFRSLEQLADGAGGMDKLSPELRDALSAAMADSGAANLGEMASGSGRVAPENMARILEAMAGAAGGMGESAGTLAGGNPGGTGEAGGAGESPGRADGTKTGGGTRIQTLSEALANMSFSALAGLDAGSGGIDKGGGATPLTFGAETDAAGQRFSHQPLPEAEGGAPGQYLGRERSLPGDEDGTEEQPVHRSGAAVRDRVNAGREAARLGPERARAAERYFEMLNGGGNAR